LVLLGWHEERDECFKTVSSFRVKQAVTCHFKQLPAECVWHMEETFQLQQSRRLEFISIEKGKAKR